jgi:hypothetical protein
MKKLLFIVLVMGLISPVSFAAKAKKASSQAAALQAWNPKEKKASCVAEKGPHAEFVRSIDPLITCFKFDPRTGIFAPNTMTKNFVSVKTLDDGQYQAACRIPVVDSKHPKKKTQEYKYTYTVDARGRLTSFKGQEFKIGPKSKRAELAKKVKLFNKHPDVKMASKGVAVLFKYNEDVGCLSQNMKFSPGKMTASDRLPASEKPKKASKKKTAKVAETPADWE